MERTPRVKQLEAIFDLKAVTTSRHEWDVELPLDDKPWNIGLIVGPSGSGKSTILAEAFSKAKRDRFSWPKGKAVVDAFPTDLSMNDVTAILSSVGFSSPPSWLKPYAVLSNGEQFRVNMARLLAEPFEPTDVLAIDEFTSVVDRVVAQTGSVAVARAVRKRGLRLVVASCHYDIIDWLQPDWVYQPADASFAWRSLQRRPAINLTIRRVSRDAWRLFGQHHYLSDKLSHNSRCFAGFLDGDVPVTFVAIVPQPHAVRPGWRAHRLVCLPDYQGLGFGAITMDLVASVVRGMGRRLTRRLAHPAVLRVAHASPHWQALSSRSVSKPSKRQRFKFGNTYRAAQTFEYVGPAMDYARARPLWFAQ